MLVLKIFISGLAIISVILIFLNCIRKGTNLQYSGSEATSVEDTWTIEGNSVPKKSREYISFRLVGSRIPRVWEFELSEKLTTIGRSTEKFQMEKAVKTDMTLSREHLAFFKDKSGRVNFIALKGAKNPVYIISDGHEMAETGRFTLPPDKPHCIRMGNTEMEVYYRGAGRDTGVPEKYGSYEERDASVEDGTRVYATPKNRERRKQRRGTLRFKGTLH